MSVWIVDGGKIRPTYPECPFLISVAPPTACGGEVEPIANLVGQSVVFNDECGIMIERTDGTQECCLAEIKFHCKLCNRVACEECFNGNWKGR